MSESVYNTPLSTSAGKSKTPRRRALSPRTTPYSSPFQVIDLDNETVEGYKRRLLEAESIIQDLRRERDELEEQLQSKAGLNESVIIENSHRISHQETRIFKWNTTDFEKDVTAKKAEILELKAKVSALEIAKSELSAEVSRLTREKSGCEDEFQSKMAAYHALQTKFGQETKATEELRNELQTKIDELAAQRTRFESAMAEMQCKLESSMERIQVDLSLQSNLEAQVENLHKECTRLKLALVEKEGSLEKQKRRSDAEADAENRKVLRDVRQRLEFLTPVKKETSSRRKEREEYLQLSAKVIEETMDELKAKNARLERELREKSELVKSTKEELKTLRETMRVTMGDSEMVAKMLHEQNERLTLQKADIRCELLETRRQLEGFDAKRLELERQRDEAIEDVTRIQNQKRKVEEELDALRRKSGRRDEEVEELTARLAGMEVIARDYEIVKKELARTHEKVNEMGKLLVMADQQTSHFKSLKESAEGSRRRAIEQCNEMVAKIRELEKSLVGQRRVEEEVKTLKDENERQAAKIEFMKEEIQEMHLDYRSELSRMAVNVKSQESAEELRVQLSQRDSELRSAKKRTEEVKADNRKVQEMLDEVRQQQQNILDENVRLRKGMADALAKIEEYKRSWESAQEQCERLEREKAVGEEKMNKLEDELHEKRQQVSESEQVVDYLHSQINAKQNKQPKLGRRSTLLSTVNEMDTSVYRREAEEVRQMEEEKQKLMRDLADKKRRLAESKSHSTTNTTTVSSSIETTTTVQTSQSASELSHSKQGTMRHDIPHKWKNFRHIGVLSMKCSLCFEAISPFHKANKCAHCDVQVHAHCAPRVNNTCGMPVQCANYYRENHTTISSSGVAEGRMNGWLRVYMDDCPGTTWIASWTLMEHGRISFYDNDGVDLKNPFFSIDLNVDQWVLRAGQEMPVECNDAMRASNVLMLKMPRRSLYILAPSQPAARRWAECLQNAQRKRMMSDSRSSSIAEYACLLVLNSPNNLKIFKAHTIEDWIVFATQTGLFFTSISQPRAPMRIAGPSSVTSLEIMSEINCVAMVVNTRGQLALIPMDSLTLAMQSTQPSIRPELLPEFCHVTTIKYHQQNGQRFLIVADETHLHVRKYNATRDVFSHFAKLDVPEPVTSIESAPNGVVVASDTFYYVFLDQPANVSARPLLAPKSSDFPISAHVVSGSELLLAYQNYGVFVAIDGTPTRHETIEWAKMPMEFTYTAPFLYVIHEDSIEILEVAEYSGDRDSKTLMEEREVFECVNAHVIGRQYEGVLISASSKNSTEVHRFTAPCHKRTQISKRRGQSPINTLKRSKN